MQSKVSPGIDRHPSSPSWVVVGQMQGRIDQVSDHIVDDVREHPQTDPELWCGQSCSRRIHHRVGEILDKVTQLLVEVDDGLGLRTQHRVAEQTDLTNGHPAILGGRAT